MLPFKTPASCLAAVLLAGAGLASSPHLSRAQPAPEAKPAEAAPEVLATVAMELVPGLHAVDRRARPLRRKLSETPPDGLDVSSLPEGTWLYGSLPLTKTRALGFVVSKDRGTLWFDGNGDGRLEKTELHVPSARRGNVKWFNVQGLCSQEVDGKTHELLMPMAVGVTKAPGLASYSRLDCYRKGRLELDGQGIELVVLDRTFRGWFSHLNRDQLIVDINGDGVFDTGADSNETYRLGSPFPMGDRDLKVSAVGPLGDQLSIVASDKPARRLASLTQGSKAPEFSAEAIDGSTVSLSALGGSWVLLDFWATWCGPCIREFPHLKSLRETMPEVKVVGISADRSLPPLENFVKAREISWPQIYDNRRKVRALYRVNSFPTTYLIAPDGTIAGKNLRGAQLAKRITTLKEAWDAEHGKGEAP